MKGCKDVVRKPGVQVEAKSKRKSDIQVEAKSKRKSDVQAKTDVREEASSSGIWVRKCMKEWCGSAKPVKRKSDVQVEASPSRS